MLVEVAVTDGLVDVERRLSRKLSPDRPPAGGNVGVAPDDAGNDRTDRPRRPPGSASVTVASTTNGKSPSAATCPKSPWETQSTGHTPPCRNPSRRLTSRTCLNPTTQRGSIAPRSAAAPNVKGYRHPLCLVPGHDDVPAILFGQHFVRDGERGYAGPQSRCRPPYPPRSRSGLSTGQCRFQFRGTILDGYTYLPPFPSVNAVCRRYHR